MSDLTRRDIPPPPVEPGKPHQITQTVRAGLECDAVTGAVVPPIHLSSTFAFRCFGEKRGYDYTRSGNPTRDLLAQALAELELGAGAVVTATGMAAITLIGYLIPQGGRIVAPHDCYGGTYRLFDAWRRRGERVVDFVNFGDEAALREALAKPAALLWIETPSNPLLRITDIEACAALGRACGALVVVDNTFLSPAWQQPIALGAVGSGEAFIFAEAPQFTARSPRAFLRSAWPDGQVSRVHPRLRFSKRACRPRGPLIYRCWTGSKPPSAAAGVGTFPGWLGLAVAPASKGLIPQPVSMSGWESRA
jgi:hypothetical protein